MTPTKQPPGLSARFTLEYTLVAESLSPQWPYAGLGIGEREAGRKTCASTASVGRILRNPDYLSVIDLYKLGVLRAAMLEPSNSKKNTLGEESSRQ